ncbi:hypothetical protein ACU4GI_33465 [Cupriavidus basilensis]
MNLKMHEQMGIAFWLSMATVLAVTSRSLSTGLPTLEMGAIVMAPMIAARGLHSPRKPLRWLSRAIIAGVGLLALAWLLAVIERWTWFNADSYPSWLASEELRTPAELDKSNNVLRGACGGKGGLSELRDLPDGTTIGRCGFFWWDGKTYIYHFDPVSEQK